MFSVFRSPKNPFLSPMRARPFEAIGTFNPSVVMKDELSHLFYRAVSEPDTILTPGRGFSTIGYTSERDDEECTERTQIISPTETWDKYGCEDPRATYFEGKWYVFYTALGGFPFNADTIKVAVAVGDGPTELHEKHLVTPFNAKAATLFPERVNGDVVLLLTVHTDWTPEHPRPRIALARAKNVEDFWNHDFWNEWYAHLDDHDFPDVRRGDTEHIEVGATPLLTEHGWLLIYSHIQNYYDEPNRLFGVEALLLDRNDPMKILLKTEYPFLVPEESYEKYGLVANIVFPTGAHLRGDRLTIFYGAADTFCARARLSLSDLLESMDPEKRVAFLKRASDEPILSMRTSKDGGESEAFDWEAGGVSNAAAIDLDGSVHLLYRAATIDNHSTMGYARLKDALHVDERLDTPVYAPREDFESHGTEDPRLTMFEGKVYVTYTGFDGSRARGVLASIDPNDFVAKKFNWSKPVVVTPDGVNDKDVCLMPDRIDGNVAMVHRIDPNISVDLFNTFPPDAPIERSSELMMPRPGMWDSIKVGAAAAPLRIEEGWLLMYHAVGSDYVYRLGAALLDESMSTVLARTASPIFEPVLQWEKEGIVKNVVFSCGMILRDDTLYVYYGGADTAIGVATISKNVLLQKLQPHFS